jgi:hypothetical protein
MTRPYCSRLRRLGATGSGGADRPDARLELLEPEQERVAGAVSLRPRHLDERELEREARIPSFADLLDGEGEKVDQA